jgi:hypothetical protein
MDVKEGDKFQGKNTGKIWVVYFNSDFNCLSMHLIDKKPPFHYHNLDDFEWDLMIKIKEGVKR